MYAKDARATHDETAFPTKYYRDGHQNMMAVSRITGIPYRTIQYYARTRHWPERYPGATNPTEAERGA